MHIKGTMEKKFSILEYKAIEVGIVLPSYKNSLLLMNPSDIKMLKLLKNHPVLLISEKRKMIFRSWPCTSVPPSSVVIPSVSLFGENLKNSVILEVCNQLIDYADRVVLTFDRYESFMESENFRKYLLTKLDQLYLTEGLILCISYLGCNCRCTVKKIISSRDETLNEESIPDICSYASSLNVTDDSSVLKEAALERSFICSTPKFSKVSKCLLPENFKNTNDKSLNDSSKQFYLIHRNTRILLEIKKAKEALLNQTSFQDLCGLKEQFNHLKSLINSFLNQNSRSMENRRGIILTGASGTGKSIMVQALANEFHLPVSNLNNFIFSRNKEELKVQLQTLFKKAEDNAPSILFLDNIDSFCKEYDISSSRSRSATAHLVSTMIYRLLNSGNDTVIIGSARNISDVDSSLRKPGLLETEVYFGIPSVADRKEILDKILNKVTHTLSKEQVSEISEITHGFTGGDLNLLCNKSIISSHKRSNNVHSSLHFEDLKQIVKDVKPSSVAEFKFEVPNIKWNDIGGMHAVKQAIAEMVDWPIKFAEKFKKLKIPSPRGILLYGPPGCSKTMIAKALASESSLNFISIKGPQLFNKYVGESEKAVSELFAKARSASPCILFFDEIDSMSSIRGSTTGNSNVSDRILTQLLVEIDGIDVLESHVHIIAATNIPQKIDKSLLRPGRFDKMIYVTLPDAATRKEIFEVKMKNMPLSEEISILDLVEATQGYTGAEVAEVCNVAARSAIEEYISSHDCKTDLHASVVTNNHFYKALACEKPRTTKEMLKSYVAFQGNAGKIYV